MFLSLVPKTFTATASMNTLNAKPKLSARRTSDKPTWVFCIAPTASTMLVMGTRSLGKSVVQSVVPRAEEIIHSCSIVSDDGSKSKTYSATHTVNIIDYVMILWQIASRKR